MLTQTEIYTIPYLTQRAKQAVLTSLKELAGEPNEAKDFAADALRIAEQSGCEDLGYLDELYLRT